MVLQTLQPFKGQRQTLQPIVLQPIKKKRFITPGRLIGAGLLAASFTAPGRILKIGAGIVRFVAPKTLKGALIGAASVPVAVGVLSTPTGKRIAKEVFDPRKGFERGKTLGAAKVGKSTLGDFAAKAGLVGLGVGAAAVGVKAIAKKVKEKAPSLPPVSLPSFGKLPVPQVLPSSQVFAQPTLGAVEQPKEKVVPLETVGAKPTKIINTFKPEISIRFSKSKRFINQQNLIKL